ncbi:DinB family protein [Virgibacillus halodenitrificans]|uniref:DinB family protein n=1 Tax=Virgibacillus halodenitrificans TaxID=1482 RepID=UPI000EF4D082
MENQDLFKITNVPRYDPQIGKLVSMMNYARFTTLSAVKGLTTEQLDYLQDENSNTIGSLLLHMAAVEFGFQVEIFDKRKPNEEENREWGAAYELGQRGRKEIKGKPLEYYLETLNKVRERTLKEFKARNDNWLNEERYWDGLPSNNYFIWFHVFEDEVNHRGQIRWLRRRVEENL